jgi:cell division protein FtsB
MPKRVQKRNPDVRAILRRSLLPASLVIVVAFFGSYAVFGPNGALAYGQIKQQLASRQTQLTSLDKQRDELRNRVNLLDPNHANLDMADDQARKKLGAVRRDEVILELPQSGGAVSQ